MNIVYIGLGSNLNAPLLQLKKAIQAVDNSSNINLLQSSSFYSSRPLGPQAQPDFVNAVIKVATTLGAVELLQICQDIEQKQGRVRETVWGPRTIDLDILLFGNDIMHNEKLTVPHPGLKEREFVVYPLLEIAPDLILPCGEPLQILAKSVALNGLFKLNELKVDS